MYNWLYQLIGFQSTLPVRGATWAVLQYFPQSDYFNPRSPCGERPLLEEALTSTTVISIHAPRAGSDALLISAPNQPGLFQSTLPVRGATPDREQLICGSINFNPRSPCGERRGSVTSVILRTEISIHAPRAGSDTLPFFSFRRYNTFQSTLPVRGATY